MCGSSSTPARAESNGGGERLALPADPAADIAGRIFTPATLAAFDGTNPALPVLIAFRGRVYDVSGRFMWMNGRHFWLRAGRDLTASMHEAPHGEEMLDGVPCVGVLVTGEAAGAEARPG